MATVRIATVTVRSASPRRLAEFWRDLLAYVEVDHPTESIRLDDPSGVGPTLLIQPAPSAPQQRVHFDLRPDNKDAAVTRALALGATHLDVGQSGDEGWVVLADPDGNPFCVLASDADLVGG